MVVISESYLLRLPSFPFTFGDAIFARMAYMFVCFLIKYRIYKLLMTQLLLFCVPKYESLSSVFRSRS